MTAAWRHVRCLWSKLEALSPLHLTCNQATRGRRKATGALKLIHDVFGKDPGGLKNYLREFDDAINTNRDLKNYISKACSAADTTDVYMMIAQTSGVSGCSP